MILRTDVQYVLKCIDLSVEDQIVENLTALSNKQQILTTNLYGWIKERLRETGMLNQNIGMIEDISFVTCIFHFYPWDEDQYGQWELSTEDRSLLKRYKRDLSPAQSPLQRLIDGEPVDRVSYRVNKRPHIREHVHG